MSEQNRYRIERDWKKATGEWDWRNSDYWWETADTWQDAIHDCLDDTAAEEEYAVGAETPSEDGKSGSIEIQFDPPWGFYAGAKIRATLLDD